MRRCNFLGFCSPFFILHTEEVKKKKERDEVSVALCSASIYVSVDYD